MRLPAVWLALLLPAVLAAQAARRPSPRAHRTGTFLARRLTESSGVVVSRRYPGLLWTMNDSGGDAALFLTDTTGAARGLFTVPRAVNIDWEALGFGPCGERKCLFVGDTGDNEERRPWVTIYRLPEPMVSGASGSGITARAEAVDVVYPDGPHDVEAMYVEPDGAVILLTKGRRGGVLAFRVLPTSWRIGQPVCDVAGLEPQGEGVDWWDSETLILTSERGLFPAGTITLLRCLGK